MTKTILALSMTAVMFVGGWAHADDEIRPSSISTNLEVLEGLARQVVDRSLDEVPLDTGEIVLIRYTKAHAVAWMVENYLAGRLAALGSSVYLDVPPPGMSEENPQGAASNRERSQRRKSPAERDTTTAVFDDGPRSGGNEGVEREGPWPGTVGQEATPDSISGAPDDAAAGGGVEVTDVESEPEEAVPSEEGSDAAKSGVESTGSRAAQAPYTPAGDAPPPDRILEFRVGELDVSYTRRWRKSLFGSAMIERSARAVIFFRLLDAEDGRVLWTHSDRLEKRDVVPQKLLAGLEDAPGQSGSKSAVSGGIGRVIEPIVVSGIVVGLVLLFYSSRT